MSSKLLQCFWLSRFTNEKESYRCITCRNGASGEFCYHKQFMFTNLQKTKKSQVWLRLKLRRKVSLLCIRRVAGLSCKFVILFLASSCYCFRIRALFLILPYCSPKSFKPFMRDLVKTATRLLQLVSSKRWLYC